MNEAWNKLYQAILGTLISALSAALTVFKWLEGHIGFISGCFAIGAAVFAIRASRSAYLAHKTAAEASKVEVAYRKMKIEKLDEYFKSITKQT